jgi:hypothetical protein
VILLEASDGPCGRLSYHGIFVTLGRLAQDRQCSNIAPVSKDDSRIARKPATACALQRRPFGQRTPLGLVQS